MVARLNCRDCVDKREVIAANNRLACVCRVVDMNVAMSIDENRTSSLELKWPLSWAANVSEEHASRVENPNHSSLANPEIAAAIDNAALPAARERFVRSLLAEDCDLFEGKAVCARRLRYYQFLEPD